MHPDQRKGTTGIVVTVVRDPKRLIVRFHRDDLGKEPLDSFDLTENLIEFSRRLIAETPKTELAHQDVTVVYVRVISATIFRDKFWTRRIKKMYTMSKMMRLGCAMYSGSGSCWQAGHWYLGIPIRVMVVASM